MTCDPYARPPIGFALFIVVLSGGVTFLPWVYHYLILPAWGFIDPNNPLPTSTPIWIGIGSVVGLICQAALSMVKLWIDKKERQDDADRKERLEKDERDRKDLRERAEADRRAGLDELRRQIEDAQRERDVIRKELEEKDRRLAEVEAKANRTDERADRAAEVATIAKTEAQDAKVKARIIEAKGEDTGAKVAVIQREILKQNILPKADPSRPADAPRHTLVIAEDDPDWVGQLSGEFFGMGFDVKTGVTLDKAMMLIEKDPHFAIIDLKLAGEDGTQIIEAIKEKGLRTEVVVFTAADDERLNRARELVGPDRVIQKGPTDAGDKLIALIQRVMEERRRKAGI